MASFLPMTALSFSQMLAYLLHQLLPLFIILHIFTRNTGTIFPTPPRGGIALTVHLKAEGLLTVAPDPPFLSRAGGGLLEGAPLREGIFVHLRCVNEGWDLDIFGEVGGEGVDCVYHLETLLHLGHILNWWKKIEDFFWPFGHGSVEGWIIINLIKLSQGDQCNIVGLGGIGEEGIRGWGFWGWEIGVDPIIRIQ